MKEKKKSTELGLALFLVLLVLPWSGGAQSRLSEDQRLERGDIIVRMKEAQGSRLHLVEGVALFMAAPGEVWKVLTDYGSYYRIFPAVSRSEVLERNGSVVRVRIGIDNLWPYPDFDYILRFEENPGKLLLSWTLEEGNIKAETGSCQVQEVPPEKNRTKVIYSLFRDTGEWFIPPFTKDLDTRSQVVERLLALRKEVRARKQPLTEKKSKTKVSPQWRKVLFWWEKEQKPKPEKKAQEKSEASSSDMP